MKINFIKRETDFYKESHTFCIAKTHGDTCSVHTLEEYIIVLGVKVNCYLLESLTFCKNTNVYQVRRNNCPLFYTRAREIVLHVFEERGLDINKFGLHSLRS